MHEVTRLETALRAAGIPYRISLQAEPSPRLVLTVPQEHLEEARLVGEELDADLVGVGEPEAPASFPWGPFRLCASLAMLHVLVVAALVGPRPTLDHLLRLGALTGDRLLGAPWEPWRLLTSLVLHADLLHAAWNGLALVAFGVPVVERFGTARAAPIYVVAGVGGGILATLAHGPHAVVLGASGAISGLFGAWLVERLGRLRVRRTRREVVRVAGVGLLYLPALLNPTTPEGGRVSVAAHVGGLVVGALLTWGFLHRERARGGSG